MSTADVRNTMLHDVLYPVVILSSTLHNISQVRVLQRRNIMFARYLQLCNFGHTSVYTYVHVWQNKIHTNIIYRW